MDSTDVPRHAPGRLTDDLSVREHMALAVEARTWVHLGARDAYIRDHLGWSSVEHAQVVADLIETSAANAAYPALCARLRRLRDRRRAVRSASRLTAT